MSVSIDLDAFALQIADYFRHKMPDVEVRSVDSIVRIHGGASRETYRLKLHSLEDGEERTRGLILRRDPEGSLIDTERALEFSAFRAFHGSLIPVPEAIFLEEDTKWLGRPFFVMEEIEGCEAASPFGESPYPNRDAMGAQFWQALGAIAAHDVEGSGIEDLIDVPSLDGCWSRELDYWEKVVDDDELEPQPVLRAAIRHLRRNPPAPAQSLSIVHGDYRTGNFLYDAKGDIQAILDWEMVHIGDPYEDLAWALNPLWAHGDPEKPAGLIAKDQAIAHWCEASGCEFDPDVFAWWLVFSCVKGLGIWISSSKEYSDGVNKDPVLALAGWICTSAHNQILIDLLRPEQKGQRNEA